MSVTHADLTAQIFAFAEKRLGRKMTAGELRMDVATMRAEHGKAKTMLAEAIKAEMLRVVKAKNAGRVARMKVTPGMIKALQWIYDRGVEHARKELKQIGVDSRSYAATADRIAALAKKRLTPMLGAITVRIDATGEGMDLSEVALDAMLLRLAERAPGALDAASRLVSTGFTAGLTDVFEGAESEVGGWEYSAVNDDATCDECATHDGEVYDTLDEAYGVLPDFGPNPDCYGEGRCRCRLVPAGPSGG